MPFPTPRASPFGILLSAVGREGRLAYVGIGQDTAKNIMQQRRAAYSAAMLVAYLACSWWAGRRRLRSWTFSTSRQRYQPDRTTSHPPYPISRSMTTPPLPGAHPSSTLHLPYSPSAPLVKEETTCDFMPHCRGLSAERLAGRLSPYPLRTTGFATAFAFLPGSPFTFTSRTHGTHSSFPNGRTHALQHRTYARTHTYAARTTHTHTPHALPSPRTHAPGSSRTPTTPRTGASVL